MNTTCISVRHVSQIYGSRKVLSDICLEIEKGCIYGILGPSGCGKTTVIKTIAGILVPTEGTVHVLGEQMPKLHIINRIGYMAQSDALYMNLSGRDNIEFFAAMYGMKKNDMKCNIDRALELVKLSDHQHKLAGSYSGGMKRRLSLPLAIVHNPEVLILDEPTVGIDPLLRRDIWEELNTMRRRVKEVLASIDEAINFHDFRMVRGDSHTNLIFDVALPYRLKDQEKQIKEKLDAGINDGQGTQYYTVITFDSTSFNTQEFWNEN